MSQRTSLSSFSTGRGTPIRIFRGFAVERPGTGYPLFSRRNDRSFASIERGESPVWSQMMPFTII